MRERVSDTVKRFYISRVANSSFQKDDGLPYWREKIFNGIIFVLFVFGTIAIIPNLIASFKSYSYIIILTDILVYLAIIILFIFKKINLKIKIYIVVFFIYLLSLVLLIGLGPFGPGLIWLISGSIFVALMLGLKQTLYTIAINFLIIAALSISIHFHLLDTPFFQSYSPFNWLAVGMNVIVVNSICSLPLSFLINGLENSLAEEKKLKLQLVEKNKIVQQEMTKAQESDKLKSAFLTNLSHEIRTPMNAIIGFSDLIAMEEEVTGSIRKYSDQIIQNTTYLNNIINDIVEISLIELGQINIRNELFNLSQLMYEIEQVIEALPLRKNKPNLIIRFIQDTKYQNFEIFSDKTHLKQILINLITNALKYTFNGYITIEYKVKQSNIEFFVRDTGVGIPDSEKEKIFVRFTKIDRKGKYHIQGMGIGLSITKGLTEALGGKIWFESEENRGSCFYFLVPIN